MVFDLVLVLHNVTDVFSSFCILNLDAGLAIDVMSNRNLGQARPVLPCGPPLSGQHKC